MWVTLCCHQQVKKGILYVTKVDLNSNRLCSEFYVWIFVTMYISFLYICAYGDKQSNNLQFMIDSWYWTILHKLQRRKEREQHQGRGQIQAGLLIMSLNYNISLNLEERCADPLCLLCMCHMYVRNTHKKSACPCGSGGSVTVWRGFLVDIGQFDEHGNHVAVSPFSRTM